MKPGRAAKVLGIDYADLPRLDRPWTKRDVRALCGDRPQWLTDARRRYATGVQQEREERITRLDDAMTRLGYNAPDAGTLDQAVLYIDPARTHLMTETKCTEGDADAVAWRRWPGSMTEEQNDAESVFE
jgi:hypothetical protein